MTLQVLVSTMNQTDHSLLDRMNIRSDAIVVNQCDRDEIERFEYNGHQILWMSLQERGVGLSRNTALLRATADIVLFADEDVHYQDDYVEIVQQGFLDYPNMDGLVWMVRNNEKVRVQNTKGSTHRLNLLNCLRYGANRIAWRREKLIQKRMSFSLLFGGGTQHGSGEDTIFITDALKRGIKIMALTKQIGTIDSGESTWFTGYNEKYFYDKGVLMHTVFGPLAYILTPVLFARRRQQTKELGLKQALRCSIKGIRDNGKR